jgi:hypothetical protein
LIIAISTTNNPLGSWKIYSFADNSFFVDFPKFAIWNDAYYATSNDFNTTGSAYLGSSVYAFDRTKMLAGDPTATAIRIRLNDADGRYFAMAPVSLEGNVAPPAGAKGSFMYYTDDAFTVNATDVDSLYLFNMTPDFATPANTVLSTPQRFVLAALDEQLCTATRGRCIDQQTNTTIDLEGLAGRISNKIVYRNFGTYEGIVLNLTVDADGAGKAGIRWIELKNAAGTWNLNQEATWAPDANERWLGSMAYDALGNIGLMYNVSGTSANPSIRFTGRNVCDPLNTMTLPETIIIDGTLSNGSARYGDYNVFTIDPADNRTLWLTAQHNNGSTNWNTRIASVKLNNCSTSPAVRFETTVVSVIEDSLKTVGTGCQRYKDFVVNVVTDNTPSQPATINLVTSGTATNGSDYTITPTSVVLSSGNLSKPFTIRVFEDNNFEGTETITISYTINAGGGNVVADTYNQQFNLSIIDNDITAEPNENGSILFTEGFGTAAAPGPAVPANWTVANTGTTNVWTYSANGGAGVVEGAAHITDNTVTNPLTYNAATPATSRLRSPLLDARLITGNRDSLKLFIAYKCNGEFSNSTFYDFGRIQYSLDGTTFTNVPNISILQGTTTLTNATFNLPAALKGNQFYVGFYWENDNSIGGDPPFTIDSIAVFSLSQQVETAVASGSGYITTSQPVHFFSSTGKAIATIRNMSEIGCLTASVATAGVGRRSATINGSTAFVSNKAIQLTPDVVFPGTYRATFYFTTAEMADWGATATALNLLKVTDSDPLGSSITGTIVSPFTVDDQRATKGYIAYTAIFSGFSKFLLTSSGTAPLPVQDLQFAVRPVSKSIALNWSTRAELNTQQYVIERSINGTQFLTIGQVRAKGNSNQLNTYSFVDHQVNSGVLYYYRLRQVDIDQREHVSAIKTAILNGNNTSLVLQPNPAQNTVRIVIANTHVKVDIQLLDAAGKLVLQTNKSNTNNGIYNLNIEALAKGTYTLKVTTEKESYSEKLVKQ